MGSENPWFDDAWVLRFCRARKFDLPKVIEMWSNFMAYRNENDIDRIVEDFPSQVDEAYKGTFQYYARGYIGVDKIGRPVYVDRISVLNVPKLMETCGEEKMFRGLYY